MENTYNPNFNTIVLLKLSECPFCKEYEKRWPEMKKHLEIRAQVNTDSVTKIRGMAISGIYKDVEKYIGPWYPCLVWISAKSLNSVKEKNEGKSDFSVNGKVNPQGLEVIPFGQERDSTGKMIQKIPLISADISKILSWIENINTTLKNTQNINHVPSPPIQPKENKVATGSSNSGYCVGIRRAKKYTYT
jgi:hypothetical protein